jgi:diguanylate cyclase (GGDEF)-like protein/PAS domain S-box-containing protein
VAIGDGVGSCGTAAYRGERVIVEDVQQHPYWTLYRDMARQAGVRSCWSQPIKNAQMQVIGTFAIYHRQPAPPTENELLLIERYANLVQLVIESYRAQNELHIAATAFESQEGMLITDANSVILRANRAFTNITGYTAEDVIGKNPRMLSSGRQDANFYAAMWESIDNTGAWEGEIWNRRKNGEVYPEHLTITAVKDKNGIVTNYVASLTDITVSKAAADKIKNLAFYDPLTRLPNRRLLLDRLEQALAYSARSGRSGALLFIDLDNFKALNDTLGHDIGDLLLQQVAQLLESCVREGDTVARLGGDEFVVMLEGLSGQPVEAAAQTEAIGEKVLATLNQSYRLAAYECRSTPSIGATLFNGHELEIEELFKQADIAMYQAKKAGRNTLRFFDPAMQAAVTARVAMESDLRYAISVPGQLLLYYQAQVESSGRLLGAEVLVRWKHPERGMVFPGEFIPLAEESGLILPLGHWVLTTACQQLAAWAAQPGTAHLTVSVNISAKQFRLPTFVEEVLTLVDYFGVDPAKLKLEITESLLLDNVDEIIAKMTALKARGINFSMDDFGTGYSSLQYLKRLPLDQLKIDQSFVRDIAVDSSDREIVRTIIAMAQSLNLNVIAEGVETEAQRQLLLGKGCTHYQGYLFGKPVPIDQFDALLQQG